MSVNSKTLDVPGSGIARGPHLLRGEGEGRVRKDYGRGDQEGTTSRI